MDNEKQTARAKRRAARLESDAIWQQMRDQAGVKARRRRRSLARRDESIWFGLGVLGIVGWSVTVPTLLFLALGIWIDATWPSRYSWTLMLLLIGVAVGCTNAWIWVRRELAAIRRQAVLPPESEETTKEE